MMSLEAINHLAAEQAARAARENKVPLIIEESDNIHDVARMIPNIGSYRPDGWELVDELFVDSSGVGRPGEPALTYDQFCDEVETGYGYAIIQEGQFQIYVGKFKTARTIKSIGFDDSHPFSAVNDELDPYGREN